MATSVETEKKVPTTALVDANFFELSHGTSTISYTVSNIAGKPVVTYNDGSVTRSFTGGEVRRESTSLGTLVTVTLELIADGPKHLLTLVVPEVLVATKPEKVRVPIVFSTVQGSIVGLPLNPGQVQTYEVTIFSGAASFLVS